MERRIRTDFRPRYTNTGSTPTTGAERGIGGECKCDCGDYNQQGTITRGCYSFGKPCAEICVQCCKHPHREQVGGAKAFFNGNTSRDSNCNSFNNRTMFDDFNGFTGFTRDSFTGVRDRNFQYARGRSSVIPTGGTTPSGSKQGGCPPCNCTFTIVQFDGKVVSAPYCCDTGQRCDSAGAFTGIYPADVKEAYATNKEGLKIPANNMINRYLMEDNSKYGRGQEIDLYEAAEKAGLEVVDEREFKNFLECRCSCIHTYYGTIASGADPMPIFCCGSGPRCGWGYRSGAKIILVDFPTQIMQPNLVKSRNFSGRDMSNGGFRLR